MLRRPEHHPADGRALDQQRGYIGRDPAEIELSSAWLAARRPRAGRNGWAWSYSRSGFTVPRWRQQPGGLPWLATPVDGLTRREGNRSLSLRHAMRTKSDRVRGDRVDRAQVRVFDPDRLRRVPAAAQLCASQLDRRG